MYKILVVDDDPNIRIGLSRLFVVKYIQFIKTIL